MSVNFITTNPAQLNERASELQIALTLDEANNLAVAEYTTAGAIALGGTALLKTGTAGAFTLAQPAPGAQLNGGQDGMVMKITILDAHAYVITTSANGVSGPTGSGDTLTAAATIGDTVNLVAFNGQWYIQASTTGTPAFALTEV